MRSQYRSNPLIQVLSNKANKMIVVYLHAKRVKSELALQKTSEFFALHWQLVVPYGHIYVNDWKAPLRFNGKK